MIWCLSNARSGDLQFGISFIALRALVREIIPNTIHTHPHTYMTQVGFPSIVSEPPVRDFDCGGQTLASRILAVTNFATSRLSGKKLYINFVN